jgi:hypothetical protein
MGGPLQGPSAVDWVERAFAAGDILTLLTMVLVTFHSPFSGPLALCVKRSWHREYMLPRRITTAARHKQSDPLCEPSYPAGRAIWGARTTSMAHSHESDVMIYCAYSLGLLQSYL